jgi:hypothetical protein
MIVVWMEQNFVLLWSRRNLERCLKSSTLRSISITHWSIGIKFVNLVYVLLGKFYIHLGFINT